MAIIELDGKAGTSKTLEILDFWWSAGGEKWFTGSEAFDKEIREKFETDVEAAGRGDYDDWTATPHGTLALLILLDQFPRNIFRGTPKAFDFDAKALKIALESLHKNFHAAYPKGYRLFFFMPFQHSEEIEMQDLSVDLFRGLDDQGTYHYALIHMDVIRRFGRFPHRNEVLGRTSTNEEIEFLASGGFSA